MNKDTIEYYKTPLSPEQIKEQLDKRGFTKKEKKDFWWVNNEKKSSAYFYRKNLDIRVNNDYYIMPYELVSAYAIDVLLGEVQGEM